MAGERGHLKVFIGMAPGVGKTYRMLQEGRGEADNGRDVAIGYLESHGRAETLAQAEGLELIPRRLVDYRGRTLEEMDLPAVIARRPELCLIDELAHTNAPGVEHEKRFEDVRDVLEAGIDVFSTVNVQHLESLNDQVEQLTGAHVRETIPDEVLSAADEVVLIDLTPEALIAPSARRQGLPTRARAGGAEQLLQDREPRGAARDGTASGRRGCRGQAARARARADRPSRRATASRPSPSAQPQAIAERLLALATLSADSERVVRRAWRSAQRLDADARRARRAPARTAAESRAIASGWRRCAGSRRCSVRTCASRRGEDVAAVAIAVARELGSTYVLIGTPSAAPWPRASAVGRRRGLGRSLLDRLLRELPGVDVRIVADPTLRAARPGEPALSEHHGAARPGETAPPERPGAD